jgi:hypothetical protein
MSSSLRIDASRANGAKSRGPVTLYEARYDRQYQRAMNGLRAYRADRRKDEKEARHAARSKNGRNNK